MATDTTAPARYTAVILDESTSVIDPAQVWAAINLGDSWRSARMGVHDRAYSLTEGHPSYVQCDVSADGGTKRRVIVTLATDDTYSVEVGRTITRGKRKWEWESEVVRGVYADALGEVIEQMYLRAYS